VNLDYHGGRNAGRKWIRETTKNAIAIIAPADEKQGVQENKADLSNSIRFRTSQRKSDSRFGRIDKGRRHQRAIESEMDVTIWNEGVFKLNSSTLESLLRAATTV